jgi:hypothetical protein
LNHQDTKDTKKHQGKDWKDREFVIPAKAGIQETRRWRDGGIIVAMVFLGVTWCPW